MKWLKRAALVLAGAVLASTFVNAPWLAPTPRGAMTVIAHRGVMQQSGRANTAGVNCTATKIKPPVHDFIENTLPALFQAQRLGARMIEIDLTQSADGKVVLFHDTNLDCRTDGRGPVSRATLSQIKALDAGYGYSPDGGKSFPLRGKGMGLIPTLEEALAALPETPLLYNVQSDDAAFGDRLIGALKAAGRDPVAMHDGFSAPAPALARIRAAWPKAWSYSDEELGACTNDYLVQGWLGLTPAACRGGTIVIPLNRERLYAGWPDRLIARMEAAGGRIIVIAPSGDHKPMGLDLPEQVGQIPVNFNGYVWVDDMWSVGPALRPADNKRNRRAEAEDQTALKKRRAAGEQKGIDLYAALGCCTSLAPDLWR